jgi:hypothetical protein
MIERLKQLFSRGPASSESTRPTRHPAEARREKLIRFIHEQDGLPEQAFKSALLPLFAARPGVRKAYLARIEFGPTSKSGVALCIAGSEDQALVNEAASVFAQQFQKGVPLDILFLSGLQESELQRVCRPFYGAG